MLLWLLLWAAAAAAASLDARVYRVQWTTSSVEQCVAERCRLLAHSPTARLFTELGLADCAREMCGEVAFHELTDVELAQLASSQPRIVLFIANIATTTRSSSLPRDFPLVLFPDGDATVLLAMEAGNDAEAGKMALFDPKLKRVLHPPVSWSKLHRQTLPHLGPINLEQPDDNNNCLHVFRRFSAGMNEREEELLLDKCLSSGRDDNSDDDDDEDDEDTSNDTLFTKAHELGLISEDSLLMGRTAYVDHVMHLSDNGDRCWLGVAWVPVFDSYHQGLGHGSRADALLIELLLEASTASGDGGKEVRTMSGDELQVRHRRFVALLTCEDDALSSVLRCVKQALGSAVFGVERIVWGLGFAGVVTRHQQQPNHPYGALFDDLNADPVYASHGEMLPRQAGEKSRQQQTTSNSSSTDEDDPLVDLDEL